MDAFLITSLAITLIAFTALWLIHVPLKDAGIVDYYWGPGFAVIGWSAFLLGAEISPEKLLFVTAVTLWALRLAVQLIMRHRFMGGEDARYAAMRANGGADWWWKSLFKVFLLQAVILWIVAAPVHAVVAAPITVGFSIIGAIGGLLFIVGFMIETVADWQLFRHRIERRAMRQTFQDGLFRYVRHPNYLGEIILWGGLGLAAYDLSGQALALAGPLLLALIIRFVSMPITEAHLASSRPDYDTYRARTSALLPLPRMRTYKPGAAE